MTQGNQIDSVCKFLFISSYFWEIESKINLIHDGKFEIYCEKSSDFSVIAEVFLDETKNHDIQAWLMGQVGEYVRETRKQASRETSNRLSSISKKCEFAMLEI